MRSTAAAPLIVILPPEVDPIPTSAAGQEEARQEQAFMQRHNYMAAPVVTKHLIKELRTLNKVCLALWSRGRLDSRGLLLQLAPSLAASCC